MSLELLDRMARDLAEKTAEADRLRTAAHDCANALRYARDVLNRYGKNEAMDYLNKAVATLNQWVMK